MGRVRLVKGHAVPDVPAAFDVRTTSVNIRQRNRKQREPPGGPVKS